VIDSVPGSITAYEFDVETGALGSSRRLPAPAIGSPDGCCTDRDGRLWVAVWGGRQVLRFAPDGVLDGYVSVPTEHVTSVTFAGNDLDLLVVTSAFDELSPDQRSADPNAGAVWTAPVDAVGLPVTMSRVPRAGWSVD